MGGMILKMAQVAASNPAIPVQYRRQFASCCDKNIPMDLQVVRRKIEDIFAFFNSEPLGVASIGQVHRAKIAKTGREVAVKVKFPNVEQLFMADFLSLKVLARVTRSSWAVPLIDEFSKQVNQEFDYEQEALNIEIIRKVLMPKFEDQIEMPAVCRDLTTDRVLTMTFLDGTRLDTALKARLQLAGFDTSRLESSAMLESGGGGGLLQDESLEAAQEQLAQPGDRQAARRSMIVKLSEQSSGLVLDMLLGVLRVKSCMGHCFCGFRRRGAPQGNSEAAEALAQADVRAVLKTLLDLWGYSILEVGTFHGDPHPGNVLLMKSGKLGLLDYGQVKTLPEEVKMQFAQLVMAVAENDKERMTQMVRTLGFEMEAEDEEPSTAAAGRPQVRTAPEVEFAESIFGGALPNMQARLRMMRSIRRAPSEMFFVIRCAVILRGIGFGLGQRVDLAKCWKKHAQTQLDACARKAAKDRFHAHDAAELEAAEAGQARGH